MSMPARLLPCALLTIAAACKPDCPDGATDRRGYNSTPIPGETGDTTTGDDTTGTSTGDTSSTTDDTSTTVADPCDDDPACSDGETPETCPEQCGECGDGIVSGTEQCDNGQANQTHWPSTPPDDACSDLCTTTVEWCGDGLLNADEQCDNATNIDPPYSPTLPPDACAPGCKLPGYCGDGEHTGEEACDDGEQTATCELDCVAPKCGDGVHNPLAGEACDDNNKLDGDGCTADCSAIERKVFVTSLQFKGDLNAADNNPDALTGLALADARCQQLAAALPGTYKAWLSTADASPSTRFDTRFTGLYRLPSPGAPIVAVGWQGLTSGTLMHPIDSDASGAAIQNDKNVWTNTLPDGTKASDDDCTGWTAKFPNLTTTVGYSAATDITWTNLAAGQLCSDSRRVYCFQDQ